MKLSCSEIVTHYYVLFDWRIYRESDSTIEHLLIEVADGVSGPKRGESSERVTGQLGTVPTTLTSINTFTLTSLLLHLLQT